MKPLYLRCAAVVFLTAFSNNVFSQMNDCNVFLHGEYVEVGISPSGSFGSSVAAPAGYYSNSDGNTYAPCGTTSSGHELGFIADPAMDGWTVGTPPFFGDYFLPGTPYQGWSVQINSGLRGDAWNTIGAAGYTNGLTGNNMAYTTSGTIVSGTWMGSMDSLAIEQETSLDTTSLYFIVKVTLTNTSHTAMNNIYYFRGVDPDNDVVQSGNFTTTNKIEYQLPNALNATVVSAAGVTYPIAYLAVGTVDTNARCFVLQSSLMPDTFTSIATMFNGPGSGFAATYAAGSSSASDVGIGLTFRVLHIAPVDSASDSIARISSTTGLHPANSASFTYFYAFSTAAMDSAIHHLTVVDTTATTEAANTNMPAAINVYPNPSKDEVHVTGLSVSSTLLLYDMMGRLVKQDWHATHAGTNTFSMGDIPRGIYILLVKDTGGAVVARLPVKKL